MKLLAFAASLRKESFNRKLIGRAAETLRGISGVEVDLAEFREFEMPIYDSDLEESSGIPKGGLELIRRIRGADALVISTPEYNGGIPGSLKNAIDWASRESPIPFEDKPLLLLGASPGALGAVRGLWHTRVPLEAIGACVYPEVFGVPRAHQAFTELGQWVDPKNQTRLEETLRSFVEYAKKLTG